VSYWWAVGAIPVFLYDNNTLAITHLKRWKDVPVEFFGLAWFASVVLLYYLAPPSKRDSVSACVFISAVPMVGLGMWSTFRGDLVSWPILVGTFGAVVILITSSIGDAPSLRSLIVRLQCDLLTLARSAYARALLLSVLAVTVSVAEIIRYNIQNITVEAASERAFRNWYSVQPHLVMPDLPEAGAIRVVVFTDYQCPACGTTIPQCEATIEAFHQKNTVPVELIAKDFPLERECNPAMTRDYHSAACEAAVAVRLVRKRLGDAAARDLGRWLYQSNNQLSAEVIWRKLAELDPDTDFSDKYDTFLKDVAADATYGWKLGVHATPTIFVNGIKLPAPILLERALRFEAERVGSTTANTIKDSIQRR
jgi:hypothetical protein